MFDFELQQRFQCTGCQKVRYTTEKHNQLNLILLKEDGVDVEWVELKDCLDRYFSDEEFEANCAECSKKTIFNKTVRFLNYPKVLMMSLQRFTFTGWVPAKVKAGLKAEESKLDMEQYRGVEGRQEGENAIPEDVEMEVEVEPEIDIEILNGVIGMGIPELGAKHAIISTGNSNAELAVAWYFENMGNPILEQPIQKIKKKVGGGGSSSGPEPNSDHVATLQSMGYTEQKCKKALIETGNDIERAMDWIFNHPDDDGSMVEAGNQEKWEPDQSPGIYNMQGLVTHLGTSVHSGHYVAHIKKGDEWILYNDHKVAHSIDAPVDKAFLYFWTKE